MISSRRCVSLLAVALSFVAAGCNGMVGADGAPSTTAGVWAPTTVPNAPGVEGVQSADPTVPSSSVEIVGDSTTLPSSVPAVAAAPVSLSNFEWSSPYELFSTRSDNTCLPQQKAMSTHIGALQRVLACHKEWAVGVSEKLHDSLGDDPRYPTENVYRLGADKLWKVVAVCVTIDPLLDFRGCVEYRDRAVPTPEPSVLCRIWDANADVAHIDRTKCTPDKDVLRRTVSESCANFQGYATIGNALTDAGMRKCDQGALVCVVQEQLTKAGYGVPVDGRLDVGTLQALMEYESSRKLLPSGTVRPGNWAAHFPEVPITTAIPAGCPFVA